MAIKMVSSKSLVVDRIKTISNQLKALELEVVVAIKESAASLMDIDSLYDIRDYIDTLIMNWGDDVVDLDDFDGGDE